MGIPSSSAQQLLYSAENSLSSGERDKPRPDVRMKPVQFYLDLKTAIPMKLDDVDLFNGDLAHVRLGQNFGYIDKAGKFVWIDK